MDTNKGYGELQDGNGQAFISFESFCVARPPFGLGYSVEVLKHIVRERKTVQIQAGEAKPLAEHGGDRKSEQNQVDNVNLIEKTEGGNAADYLTARIARDRPDILERMKQGEFKSVRAAAREAGIVKPTFAAPIDVQAAARAIRRHFTDEQINELVRLLTQT